MLWCMIYFEALPASWPSIVPISHFLIKKAACDKLRITEEAIKLTVLSSKYFPDEK